MTFAYKFHWENSRGAVKWAVLVHHPVLNWIHEIGRHHILIFSPVFDLRERRKGDLHKPTKLLCTVLALAKPHRCYQMGTLPGHVAYGERNPMAIPMVCGLHTWAPGYFPPFLFRAENFMLHKSPGVYFQPGPDCIWKGRGEGNPTYLKKKLFF